MDDIEPSNSEEGWVAKRISIVEKEIGQLTRQLKERERDIMERRIQDSIVTARIREELDHTANSRKEDKIIITGLTSKTPMPKSSVDKKNWLDKIVGDVLDRIIPNTSKHVIFASLGSRNA